MKYKPIVIIGAARSGTNILRDALTSVAGFETWPCDEINLIWRHGNRAESSDEFTFAMATPKIRAYIRREFQKIAERTGAAYVVEKTAANSLRVDFVKAVLPEARYIYIHRDGRDVTSSARRRWTAGIEPLYIARKLRYAPLSDVPYYGWRFLRNRLHQLSAGDRRQSSWGPRFAGMDRMVAECDLAVVCAAQWARCVALSEAAFAAMDDACVFRMRYEDFVRTPQKLLAEVLTWLGSNGDIEGSQRVLATVNDRSVGAWTKDPAITPQALSVLAPQLRQLRYDHIEVRDDVR